MQSWKFRYNVLKENCDDIVRERVKESSTAFANDLTNELERYGIKVEFKKKRNASNRLLTLFRNFQP